MALHGRISIRIFTLVLLGCAVLGRISGQTISISSVAVGNGIADDTTSIQTAINASPVGALIDFGSASKTYLVSDTIYFPGNRTYSGTATLKLAAAPQSGYPLIMLPYTNADHIGITGLT